MKPLGIFLLNLSKNQTSNDWFARVRLALSALFLLYFLGFWIAFNVTFLGATFVFEASVPLLIVCGGSISAVRCIVSLLSGHRHASGLDALHWAIGRHFGSSVLAFAGGSLLMLLVLSFTASEALVDNYILNKLDARYAVSRTVCTVIVALVCSIVDFLISDFVFDFFLSVIGFCKKKQKKTAKLKNGNVNNLVLVYIRVKFQMLLFLV